MVRFLKKYMYAPMSNLPHAELSFLDLTVESGIKHQTSKPILDFQLAQTNQKRHDFVSMFPMINRVACF